MGSSEVGLEEFNIPASCCKRPGTYDCRTATTNVRKRNLHKGKIFQKGCSDALINFVEDHIVYLIAVAGGIAVIQILGMICSVSRMIVQCKT